MTKRIVNFWVLFGLMLLVITYTECMAEDCYDIPPGEKFITSTEDDVKQLSDKPLVYANILWPNKDVINAKTIKEKNKHKDEVERTWYWFEQIIRDTYLPEQIKEKLILMPEMKNGDDWVIVRYGCKDLKVQIIDGRSLTIVIRADNAKRQEQAVQDYVLATFKNVFRYEGFGEKDKVKIELKDVKRSSSGFYGKIYCDRGAFENGKRIRQWLQDDTIYCWSDGNSIVFDIQKILIPSTSKVPLEKLNKGYLYVGGIPHDDKRKFIRFDNKNKIDFNEEFKKQYKSEKSEETDPNATKGDVIK